MPSLVPHPDTSYAPLRVPEALEIRMPDGRTYTLTAQNPVFVETPDLAAVKAAITAMGGTLANAPTCSQATRGASVSGRHASRRGARMESQRTLCAPQDAGRPVEAVFPCFQPPPDWGL